MNSRSVALVSFHAKFGIGAGARLLAKEDKEDKAACSRGVFSPGFGPARSSVVQECRSLVIFDTLLLISHSSVFQAP
jgi:hypothetical protein